MVDDYGEGKITFDLAEHHCPTFLQRTIYEAIAADVRQAWEKIGIPTGSPPPSPKQPFLRKPFFPKKPDFRGGTQFLELKHPVEESQRIAREGFLLITNPITEENYFLRIKAKIKKEELERRNIALKNEKTVEYQGEQWQVISLWDTSNRKLGRLDSDGQIESLVEITK